MRLQCFAPIALDGEEPAAGVARFVAVLRRSAVDTEAASLDLKLFGTSVRALTALQEFRPERANSAPFAQGLDVVEEVTRLGPAKLRSLRIIVSAKDFRWQGSPPGSDARLLLLDSKRRRGGQRFQLTAHLLLDSGGLDDPTLPGKFAQIEAATGLRFSAESCLTHITASEPGRATPEELFATALAWRELIATVGRRVRGDLALDGVPHLKSAHEALRENFAPRTKGNAARIDFGRIGRAWLKREFPAFIATGNSLTADLYEKSLSDELRLVLAVDKSDRAYSRRFSISLGVALTAPRFAPSPERAWRLTVNLFSLFGIGTLPLQWTYSNEAELVEALASCAVLVRQVLAQFEPEALKMQGAYGRRIEEFPGPRHLSAREAHSSALPLVQLLAPDAALVQLRSSGVYGVSPPGFNLPPSIAKPASQGRLCDRGAWLLTYYSQQRQETVHVELPAFGEVQVLRQHAPHGRHWPSDQDQVIRDGWLDSTDAYQLARLATQAAGKTDVATDVGYYELSSRADPTAGMPALLFLRDGMFKMKQAWRVAFEYDGNAGPAGTRVTVPAFGDAEPTVEASAVSRRSAP